MLLNNLKYTYSTYTKLSVCVTTSMYLWNRDTLGAMRWIVIYVPTR